MYFCRLTDFINECLPGDVINVSVILKTFKKSFQTINVIFK